MKLKIRLIGIDAPEVANRKNKTSQPMGEESKNYINQLIKNKTVTLKIILLILFGRSLSEIYFNNENINLKWYKQEWQKFIMGKW